MSVIVCRVMYVKVFTGLGEESAETLIRIGGFALLSQVSIRL